MPAPRVLAGCATALIAATASTASAQSPAVGMRPSDVRFDAIEHARLIVRPGKTIENATIVMKDGWIIAVGAGLVPPEGAVRHDAVGKTVYPGLIDAYVGISSESAARTIAAESGAHWNRKVIPQLNVSELPVLSGATRTELRSIGFTAAAVYPDWGVLRGKGEVVLLGSADSQVRALGRSAASAVSLNHDTDWDTSTYPGSLAGAVALVRQTVIDSKWLTEARAAWKLHPTDDDAPVMNLAVEALAEDLQTAHVMLFDAPTELEALRSAAVAREFEIPACILGGGTEFRRLREIAAAKIPLIVPLNFPKVPQLADPRDGDRLSLRALATWALASRNCALLSQAGVDYCITSSRLTSRSEFPERVRKALAAGLNEDALLTALTVAPARLLGVQDILGTVEPGKLANLVVVDGPLFGRECRIREVWVAGRRSDVIRCSPLGITGPLVAKMPDGSQRAVEFDPETPRLVFPKSPEAAEAAARSISIGDDRASFILDATLLGGTGTLRCSAVRDGAVITVTCHKDDGSLSTIEVASGTVPPPAPAPAAAADAAPAPVPAPPPPPAIAVFDVASIPLTNPFGDFGALVPPAQQTVFIHDATVWTSGKAGILEHCSMIVRDGRIQAIGATLDAPKDAFVIEASGKHVTPGLIDCHSHTGLEGGVNEGTQACTAEVRMSDAIDPGDIAWYRELAGGLTAANQLHGSANPMGGQNSVVKLRWGTGADAFPVADAKPGIKFALGENVVRNKKRYPNTRMGVESFMRDQFREAAERAHDFAAYQALPLGERERTVPPKRDLELEALAQILNGERIVHCHSYRQDEILMLIRLAEELGFKIGTFQHVLEGYKVAELIAAHGAGASSFSDWWAYKAEVMDAIPDNGSLMADSGVLVSFNSDSDELARHMNTEAAKAVRYGGISPAAALEFVTINPARQMGIGHRTGSLEQSKDADFVIWSGDPLSSFTVCEQTWIDGTKYFDRLEDAKMRLRDTALRQQLIAFAVQTVAQEKIEADANKLRKDAAAATVTPALAVADSGLGNPELGRRDRLGLMQRMLGEREAAMLDLWRRGIDPTSSRQGDCGCSEVSR